MMLNKNLEGKRVRIICTDGEIFEGFAETYIFPEDNEPEGIAAIDIEDCPQRFGKSVSFNEDEIKSIEILY